MTKRVLTICFEVMIVICIANLGFAALPEVQGCVVETYASEDYNLHLGRMTFAPDGTLYVGKTSYTPTSIWRILPSFPGPCVFESFGDAISGNPYPVLYDVYGRISGVPGCVLIGRGQQTNWYGPFSHLTAILLDGTANQLYPPPEVNFHNIADMCFDNYGALLFIDSGGRGVYKSEYGENPWRLFSVPDFYNNIAVNPSNNNIFLGGRVQQGRGHGMISSWDEENGLQDFDVTSLPCCSDVHLVFGLGGFWGKDLYVLVTGELLKYNLSTGARTVVGTGFDSAWYMDLVLGPDNALYVSDCLGYRVLKITPLTNPISFSQFVSSVVRDLFARAKDGKIQLTWTHNGADYYNVYRSTIPDDQYILIASTDSTYSTYLDVDVVNGVAYYYFVEPVFPGEVSNKASATPTERTRRR